MQQALHPLTAKCLNSNPLVKLYFFQNSSESINLITIKSQHCLSVLTIRIPSPNNSHTHHVIVTSQKHVRISPAPNNGDVTRSRDIKPRLAPSSGKVT